MKKKHRNYQKYKTDPVAAILESISDGVFTVDKDWRITSFNRSAREITGISYKDAVGRLCSDVFRASICETDCALKKTLKTGRPVINKPVFIVTADGNRIPISISTAILKDESGRMIGGAETFRDLSLVEELRKEIKARYQAGDLVSRSALMLKIFDILPEVAGSDSTVLIQGDTGTGKELLAHAIHERSFRRGKPFITVNCGALPDNLLESELFGYKAGAFTGANRDKPGRFALAEGGTLFLDEIGEVSPAFQVRLLRILQEKTYEPLGGTGNPLKTDIRFIAATNRDLAESVKKGAFRQDLFFRLNVVKLGLPPLKKRKEDIPLLIDHFISRFNRIQGKSITGVSLDVLSFLMAHDFPGNVRELENIIEHAFVLCREGTIHLKHLPDEFKASSSDKTPDSDMESSLQAMEKQMILGALGINNYSRLKASRELKMHKSTLFRKIKALGIVLPEKKGQSE